MAQIGETDTQSVFYVFVFFLSHLVSIAHPPFQATISMSGGSGAEDCRAGLPPEDESNASRLRRDADAAAVEDLDCNEHPAQGANAASTKVRHSLTLLVLFCLYSFLSNCISSNLFCSFVFTDTASSSTAYLVQTTTTKDQNDPR